MKIGRLIITPLTISILLISCRDNVYLIPSQEYINKVELNDGVTELDEEDKIAVIAVDSNFIEIEENSKLANKIQKGDILVSGPLTDYPSGFMRRVTEIAKSGSAIRVLSEDAELSDAFKDFNFSTELIVPDTLTYVRRSNFNINLPKKNIRSKTYLKIKQPQTE